jgi:hypothetical protein
MIYPSIIYCIIHNFTSTQATCVLIHFFATLSGQSTDLCWIAQKYKISFLEWVFLLESWMEACNEAENLQQHDTSGLCRCKVVYYTLKRSKKMYQYEIIYLVLHIYKYIYQVFQNITNSFIIFFVTLDWQRTQDWIALFHFSSEYSFSNREWKHAMKQKIFSSMTQVACVDVKLCIIQ